MYGTNHIYPPGSGGTGRAVVGHRAADRLDLDGQRPRRPGHLSDGAFEAADQSPPAWVVRVAVNCCKDWKKSAWVRRRLPLEAAAHAAVHLPEPGESPVLAAVQALPERYRQAVYLRYYEGYEPAEIGTLMGCTASQVSTYLYRGKAKLRNMLGGAYGQECLSE